MAQAQDDVKEVVVQEPTTPAPSTDDKKEPEVAKDEVLEALSDDEPKTKPSKAETEVKPKEKAKEPEPKPVEETKAEDEPQEAEEAPKEGKAEKRKANVNAEIRDLVAKRNALRKEVEEANAEVYQPATEEELVADGVNATEAKVEALRQQIEVRDYNEKVADAQLTISSESERVLQDFPIFNPDSKQYDKELAEEAAELLKANLIYDQNTEQVIGSNVSPYQLYKTIARATGISTTKGQLKGQQDTEKMLANADNASSSSPTKKEVDPVLAILSSDDD